MRGGWVEVGDASLPIAGWSTNRGSRAGRSVTEVYDLAVFLGEAFWLALQQGENSFRGAAKRDALRRRNDGPVYQHRVSDHGVEQRLVGHAGVQQAHLRSGGTLLAENVAR